MITFIDGAGKFCALSQLDNLDDYLRKQIVSRITCLEATEEHKVLIYDTFCMKQSNGTCTVPMTVGPSLITWYGDIAKTILANIIPLLYPES